MVSPLGNDKDTYFENGKQGRSWIREIDGFDTKWFRTKYAGHVDFNIKDLIPKSIIRQTDPGTHYAFGAIDATFKDAGIDMETIPKERFGVMFGNCLGGCRFGQAEMYNLYQDGAFAISPFMMTSWFYAASIGYLTIYHKLRGYAKTVVTDRASGTDAVGLAYHVIKSGDADLMIAGGIEAPINEYGLVCIDQGGMTINGDGGDFKTAYRPFAQQRQGFFIAEGAGFVCLEELEHALERNAPIYGELVGYATTTDAYHAFQANPDGEQMGRAMEQTMKLAGVEPRDVDYINLDAAGTLMDDVRETKAVQMAFGDHAKDIHCSAPKSQYGHSIGAAGGFDFIETMLAVKEDTILPTVNYVEPDPACALNMVSDEPLSTPVNAAMSVSCGFGGVNSALLVKKYKK
jgi:3-oxoacyl-[acyl-carrier-protein] synthase II